jgi:hypothetical protein
MKRLWITMTWDSDFLVILLESMPIMSAMSIEPERPLKTCDHDISLKVNVAFNTSFY